MSRLVYGKRAVFELLESGTPVLQKLLLAKGLEKKDASRLLDWAEKRKLPVEWVDRRQLDQQSEAGRHQGVAALAPDFRYAHLSEVLRRAPQSALLVVLDQVSDPQNLGAIIRSADGCGCLAVVIPKDHAAQVSPAVEKAAAGACAYVPIVSITNVSQALEEIKQAGFWCYGLAGEAEKSLDMEDFKGKVCLVLGSEGKGLRPLVERHCDQLLKLRMRGRVSSYNVSVAAGIALYGVARQLFAMES